MKWDFTEIVVPTTNVVEDFKTLVDMGFPILDAFKILQETNNNLEEALQQLF